MKKLLAIVFILTLVSCSSSCTKSNNNNTEESPVETTLETTLPEDNWSFYNERAEVFITSMANGDFESAIDMFDATMKQALTESALHNDIWNIIISQAGEFVSIHEIENKLIDKYYVCFTTSQHEIKGATLRIVFSEEGLVAGLFIEGYTTIETNVKENVGFIDFPIVIGEGTEYPLNGVLSIPDNATDKVPAVVLVHGSGPQDMNETIYENKPFYDIANYLASNGIAVIRYDKRTFTHGAKLVQQFGNNLTIKEETIEDAILATQILKSDSRIDEDRIFILGHSLGGMLAPRIHADGGDYAGLILLAGSPRSLLDISYEQSIAFIEETMEGEEKENALTLQMEENKKLTESIKNMSDDEAKSMSLSGGVSAYYFKEMDEHPASEYIKNITQPFLILQGSKDFQVYPDKDFAIYKELLGERANTTLKLYEGLNHLFMISTGKNIAEYQDEYKTPSNVDTQVLIDITEWIKTFTH